MANLKKTTLANLVKQGFVSNISSLRYNTNSYPFVTLLNKKGEAQNVYFGQKTSEVINNHFKEGDKILDFLKDADIVQTENSNGEVRFKFSKSISDYETDASIMEAFSIENTESEFDFVLFSKSFSAKEKEAIVPQP